MPAGRKTHYPDVPGSPRFPRLEEEILARWAAEDTFRWSADIRPSEDQFVFYDGPPFANGLPHYGHLLTGYVKDVVPRYRTMRGQRVERRFGWDCHGLPAETEAEKELGVSGRGPITEFGIERFNEYCRTSVLRYTREWERYVTRQARWVDFDNDYKTMDLSYMESVMWAIKQLWEKGLLYEDYRVLPYCWECETPLSNSETRQDDAYRDRQDPAVTVAFTVREPGGTGILRAGSQARRPELVAGPLQLWVWTTTPWTLPSNLALAVGPDITYAVFERDGSRFALGGEATVASYEKQLEGATRIGSTLPGSSLFLVGAALPTVVSLFHRHGQRLRGPRRGLRHHRGGHGRRAHGARVRRGRPDWCAAAGIPVVCPVDDRCRFTAEVPDFEGLQVFDANQPVIRALRQQRTLVRSDSYVHSYPHCWRTDTPQVYLAVTSWFVKVTAIKDRLLDRNREINWVPGHIQDGSFGKWLANARDWSISRNRFWGSPIPVWQSDDPSYPRIDVYGSLDELERDFGVRPTDLHRPAIDELTRPNPDDPTGASTMRRVTDVLDCWFESGSMPFAQVHYPFENRDWFDDHFPGDFVVEYVTQTRGWFYTLHVLAVALFDRPAFKNCVVHGILLGEDGRKMSKRLRNYPDPETMFEAHGADAMRWFFMSSPVVRGGDMVTDEKGITGAVRAALLPLWNAWYFFSLYANADRRQAVMGRTDASGTLDRYILSKTRQLVEGVTDAMDDYDLSGACAAVESFLDVLTNWYIRQQPGPILGFGERGRVSLSGRVRHAGHRAGGPVPGDGAAVAAPQRGGVAGPDQRHGRGCGLSGRTLAAGRPDHAGAPGAGGRTAADRSHLADWPNASVATQRSRNLVADMDLVRADVCSKPLDSIRK